MDPGVIRGTEENPGVLEAAWVYSKPRALAATAASKRINITQSTRLRMRNKLTPLSIVLLLVGVLINGYYLYSTKSQASLTHYFHDSNVNQNTGCDFYALYTATRNFYSGKDIYAPPEKGQTPCYFSYRYLPVGIVIGSPFAPFHPRTAYWAWVVFLELLLLVNLFVLLRIAPTDRFFGIGALAFLASSPLYLELYMGQYSLLQGTFLFAALAGLVLEKQSVFNLTFAASLCWKLNTWIALPALLVKKRWGVIVGAMAVLLVTTIPYALSHDSLIGAFSINSPMEPTGMTRGNQGLVMLAMVALKSVDPRWLLWGIPAVVIGLSMALTIKGRKAHLADLICLWSAAYFLCYKDVWEHHYIMLIPVIIILALRHRGAVLYVPGLLIALPTVYVLGVSHGWTGGWELYHHLSKPLAALIVYLYAAKKVFLR